MKICHERKEGILEKVVPDIVAKKSDAELAHLEWNMKLLVWHESKLKAKDQAEKGAALIREQNTRIEQEEQLSLFQQQQQQARIILDEQTKTATSKTRLSKEVAELNHLEEN